MLINSCKHLEIERTSLVKVNDFTSTPIRIHELPNEKVIGPLLFSIYLPYSILFITFSILVTLYVLLIFSYL